MTKVLQIYLGVVINRFMMHFDKNIEAKRTSMGLSGISAMLFLITIFLSVIPSFIPEGGLTPEVSAELFAGFRDYSSADPYRLVFGGMIYFTLLFIFELNVLRRKNSSQDFRSANL